MREIEAPVLVVHGRHDEIIPFANAGRIAAARDAPVVALSCGHNDCAYLEGEALVRIARFLAEARITTR